MHRSSKNWSLRPGRRISALLLALALTALWGLAPAVAAEQVLGVKEKLPNDLVWLFSQQSGLPLVTLHLIIKAGTLQDPKGKEGLANLTTSLLLSGTKSRNATQIAQQLDFLGAHLKGSGGDDFATISLTVLKKDLETGLEIFRDILLNPTFAPDEVKRKVAQYKAALESEKDEPMTVASRAFVKDLYGDFPYGHPVIGTPEGLNAIIPKDLVDFHRTYFRPNNAILAVVGDLTQDEARQWITKTLGNWGAAPIPPLKLPPIPPLQQRKVVVINKDISQANIILGNVGIKRHNPDFYAVQVMNYILGGGGFSSHMMEDIREKRGLAYSVSSSFNPGLEPGPFTVSLETKNPSAGEAIQQVVTQIKLMMTEPVKPQELEDAKTYFIGSFARNMDSLGKRAWLLTYVEAYGLGLDYPWKYPDLIRHLTPEDIRKVAEKYLHPDDYLLVVVGKQAAMPPLTLDATGPIPEEKKDEEKKSVK
jgi:zinc protease